MSMTREEAFEYAESKKMRLEALVYNDDCKYGNYAMYSGELSFVNAALSALRPVSRERVEKAWTAEWTVDEFGHKCSKCGEYLPDGEDVRKPQFCPECGRAMTDEAVKMVMERLEAMKDG